MTKHPVAQLSELMDLMGSEATERDCELMEEQLRDAGLVRWDGSNMVIDVPDDDVWDAMVASVIDIQDNGEDVAR